eukprot:1139421-Pelagomonas_calceolata.AAC.1
MNGMHTNRHHVGLSYCVQALSKGRCGSSLIGMDACRNEKLLEQVIPDWVFSNSTGPSAQHQSCPDAVFVRSIPCRPAQLDPTKIPLQDRDIYLVKFKLCPDTNPFSTLEAVTVQHASTATGPKNCSSEEFETGTARLPRLIGVVGTIYNDYAIKSLINLGTSGEGGGGYWAWGSGEKESPGVQEHGGQTSKSPLALHLAFS